MANLKKNKRLVKGRRKGAISGQEKLALFLGREKGKDFLRVVLNKDKKER